MCGSSFQELLLVSVDVILYENLITHSRCTISGSRNHIFPSAHCTRAPAKQTYLSGIRSWLYVYEIGCRHYCSKSIQLGRVFGRSETNLEHF